MSKEPILTLAFLGTQPKSAARALAEINRADAAAFLATVPARIATPVLSGVPPWLAAEIVDLLPPVAAAGMIRNMSDQDAASILRLLDADRLTNVLEELPSRVGRKYRKALDYPAGTVGAWIEHAITTFKADNTVGDGLKFLRQRQRQTGSHLFVVDDAHLLVGTVRIGELLAAKSTTRLGDVMAISATTLSNRALLRSIQFAPEWDEYLMLPVVGRKGNVIGGLTRQGLRKGLAADQSTFSTFASHSIWMHLLTNYLATCAGLIHLAAKPTDSHR